MIPSKYNIIIRDFPEQRQLLVYNTLRESMVVVDDAIEDVFMSGRTPRELDPEGLDALVREGFVYEQEGYEKNLVQYLFASRKYSKKAVETVIMTTEACNLRCKYCLEGELIAPRSMDEQTAHNVAQQLIERLKAHGTKRLTLDFFGGEPLLNTTPIAVIAPKLREYCAKNEVYLHIRVTTNGTLLDYECYRLLRRLSVDKIQVTIDGPKDVHDYRKPPIDGGSSFQSIIDNLQHCDNEHPKLQIRLNIDAHNVARINEILHYLASTVKGFINQVPSVYVAPTELAFCPSENWNRYVFSPAEKATAMVKIWGQMAELGLPVAHLPTYYPCGVLTDWATVVGVSGELYCCTALAGIREFQRGDLSNEDAQPTGVHLEFLTTDVWNQCLHCMFLPLCGGGCRVQSLIRTGNAFNLDCQREFFEGALETYIKANYLAECRTEI